MLKEKKWLAMLLAVAMVFTIIPTTVFAVGNGEWGSDYDTATEFTISNEEELRAFSAMVNEGKDFAGKTVKLANNITMSDDLWVPIGTDQSKLFAGYFDGQNKTIEDIKIDYGKTDDAPLYDAGGLFGYVSGSVKNLNLKNIKIEAANQYIGGIAGALLDNAEIMNCVVVGSISGAEYNGDYYGSYIGGIVGYADNREGNILIENCINKATITGVSSIGGIVGFANTTSGNIQIKTCTNMGKIESSFSTTSGIGGIIGYADDVSIEGCINFGNIVQATGEFAGGIVGYTIGSAIKNCKNNGDIQADNAKIIGGIVGLLYSDSSVVNCVNTATVFGKEWVGGIVGSASNDRCRGYSIEGCHNSGNVTGQTNVGGVVGQTSAVLDDLLEFQNATLKVSSCSNSGSISGQQNIGGIAGEHNYFYEPQSGKKLVAVSDIENCFNTGSVPNNGGAIVGKNNTPQNKNNKDLPGKITNCFWPEELGNYPVSNGAGSEGNPVEVVNNNSSYDKDGNFNNPVFGDDGTNIPNLSGSCEEFFGGHDYGEEWTTDKEATCTEAGNKHKVCNRCGTKGEITEIPALGHNAVKTEAKAATCTEDGNITYWYCDVCKKYFSDEALTTEITKVETVDKATGHETELKKAKEATCTAEGYTGDKVCKVCGEIVEQGKVIPKLAHSYKDGKCTVCGAADPNYKPTDPTDPTEPSNPDDGDTNVPETGDSSNMILWVALLFVSGIGLFGATAFSKKKRAR